MSLARVRQLPAAFDASLVASIRGLGDFKFKRKRGLFYSLFY